MKICKGIITFVVLALLMVLTACGQHHVKTEPSETFENSIVHRFTLDDAAAMFPMQSEETNAEYINRIYEAAMQLKENAGNLHDEIIEALFKQYRTTLYDIQPYRTEEEFRVDFIDGFEDYYQKLLKTAESGEEAYRDIVDVKFYGGTGAGSTSALWIYTMYYNINEELEMMISYIEE